MQVVNGERHSGNPGDRRNGAIADERPRGHGCMYHSSTSSKSFIKEPGSGSRLAQAPLLAATCRSKREKVWHEVLASGRKRVQLNVKVLWLRTVARPGVAFGVCHEEVKVYIVSSNVGAHNHICRSTAHGFGRTCRSTRLREELAPMSHLIICQFGRRQPLEASMMSACSVGKHPSGLQAQSVVEDSMIQAAVRASFCDGRLGARDGCKGGAGTIWP